MSAGGRALNPVAASPACRGGSGDVGSSGKTGSDGLMVKPTRLTQRGS
jgi:hypothetical protein